MDDIIIMDGLIEHFRDSGYIIESYTDILKIKYSNNDINILKNALKKFTGYNYKKFIVRCFTKRGMCAVTEFLIDEFIGSANNDYRWVIGNALYTIGNKEYEDRYIEIIVNKEYKSSRQMVVLLLGKTKNSKIRCALVSLLNDYDVIPQVLKALKNNLDSNTRALIQKIISDSNKANIMSDLMELKETNPDYKYIDLDGYWKLIQREGRKTIN